ncbi:MAG: hypothetical protein A3F11_11625 [Gammaproteobacteria bacterium RIFCSPHIGHO2_12_FULL_37_14]|nr:MAG: hypothetical protein A3F11_11625 [Gammaproteobacteria bacterium RIFCSPHIGHO2_12_FULL_37_14]
MVLTSNNLNARLNKDTQFCISIASIPSNFGTVLHNAAYAKLGLNFAYKAFSVSDIKNTVVGIRALNIRGCSVSMPFKESIISYLDVIDESARVIGAVNTVVNEEGCLIGYNTDALGAKIALESINADHRESVLLLGAGGVSRAILFALRQLGFKQVRVANRDLNKINNLKAILPCYPVAWSDRQSEFASLIINATSIGMCLEDVMPVDAPFLEKSRAVMDVIVAPWETKLMAYAAATGKAIAPGCLMSLEQAMAQFTLYTKNPAPKETMEWALRDYYYTQRISAV